jgi:excisionase family DNA binding protein
MPAKDPRDALLTAKDVAGLLNVDIRTLRRLRHLGDVPKPITVGRVLRWRRRDLDRWLEDGRG